jgi:hypothetical protein
MDNQPTKLEILKFIQRREIVWIRDFTSEYGYKYWGAVSRLRRLCKEGLVSAIYVRGLNQGRYALTEKGAARIDYLTKVGQASRLRDESIENEVNLLLKRVSELEKENKQLRMMYLMIQNQRKTKY